MRTAMLALVLTVAAVPALSATKAEFGTAKEAEAMVGKAIAHAKKVGTEKAYQDFTNKAPGFVDRDLYVVVYDLQGKVLAHGQNPKMVGKDLIDLRDPDGKLFVKERVDLGSAKPSFWHDYKWTDPVTKKVLEKSTYCQRHEEVLFCVGIYKR
ncbi:MAG: cache domain-containing protein [Polyangia bacterium]|jgi:signal transduction histidine kinase